MMNNFLFLTSLTFIIALMIPCMVIIDYRIACKNLKKESGNTNEILKHTFRPLKTNYFRWLFSNILVIFLMGLIIFAFENDFQSPIFWYISYLWLIIFFICLYGLFRHIRAFISITDDQFIYQGVFFRQKVLKNEFEQVLLGNFGIYIKRKSRRFPLVIEKDVWKEDELYAILHSFKNSPK